MRLIQFNSYFNHHLHIFVLNYITYIVRVHARKITTFVAYVPCMCNVHRGWHCACLNVYDVTEKDVQA